MFLPQLHVRKILLAVVVSLFTVVLSGCSDSDSSEPSGNPALVSPSGVPLSLGPNPPVGICYKEYINNNSNLGEFIVDQVFHKDSCPYCEITQYNDEGEEVENKDVKYDSCTNPANGVCVCVKLIKKKKASG